jgi:selenide,water dikinase
MTIRLTEYSHGAGCGCKISPKVLDEILKTETSAILDANLLIGNDTRDDAAVYAIDDHRAVISTTDFFMPIVDDPFDFGGIAAVNAISDIYAMGGKPLMAISILGWPVDVLSAEVAGMVVEGARSICTKAGIPLAGGHSIDSKEPIFGLAVTGIVDRDHIKSNDQAVPDCELYLTKPLGIGILTTAHKKQILDPDQLKLAIKQMLTLNDIGIELSHLPGVKAMTDVTGFGLLGHLIEICKGSNVSAEIDFTKIPIIRDLDKYIAQNTLPGGTFRNFHSYGDKVSPLSDLQKAVLCDPQTSGGLLVVVDPKQSSAFHKILKKHNIHIHSFGKTIEKKKTLIHVSSE